ncbi:MAG TPA: transcription-repair coupling factor [Steroidobacteraceae bacterium]|nr:transcription-repair coupling factor [Steroidobacteraceae bacterium]
MIEPLLFNESGPNDAGPDEARPHVRWGQLYGGSPALAIAEAAARAKGPLLVLAEGAREAERLQGEIAFFAGERLPVRLFPDWETLPYDLFAPHPDIVSERLATLHELPSLTRGVVVVALSTLLQRIAPRAWIDSHALNLKRGEQLDAEAFRARLVAAGYAHVGQVVTHGEFAVRGSLIDVFPMGTQEPLRIDLFDRDIESIRRFDPQTQRSGDAIEHLRLLPAREYPLNPEAVREFRRRYRVRFEGDPARSSVYRGVSEGLAPAGIEYYLPLFFEELATLFDYLPRGSIVVDAADSASRAAVIWREITERYEQRRHDLERPVLAPAEIALDPAALEGRLARLPRIDVQRPKLDELGAATPIVNFPTLAPPRLRIDVRAEQPAADLARFLEEFPGRVLLAAESGGRRELLLDLLRARDVRVEQVPDWRTFVQGSAHVALTVAPWAGSLLLESPPLALLTEEQIFGERAQQERRRRRAERDPAAILRELTDLTLGAPVVHEDYGVGRYQGLQTLEVSGQHGEFLVVEYADGDRIYVPVHALDRVNRYTGAPAETAPLHKLGTDQWAKARKRAAQRIRDVAAELLDLYSRRAARVGTSLHAREADYRAFETAFRFEETPDQAQAIRQVIEDLRSGKPMDRVVCGDVGFGKTEVALRAAFVAVQAGKQVAVLVPTTLLAQQHYQTFADRFADWPVRVEMLSRFRSASESNATLEGLARGAVDVVIATHRLLHANVKFKDLGLVIVDEEHRFGVRDKERLKTLRAEVDVLTLTATPIPRTLNMAMGGLRDLSLITTPPADRLAIQTFVSEWNDAQIREAALREIRRGGQIYFVHNTVETIDKRAEEIRRLVPEAQVRVGHGQMRERDLEQLMLDFYHRRFNLLVCTTIIESGIDVPTANTMIIDRADRFGLAQLHQLRGRVGRSHHRAYAYLITPPRAAMSADAIKRLEAIESLEDLGAGFTLATHDLEIRGAGELLGEEQSGQINEIGFNLYMELLDRAVAALKSGREPDLEQGLRTGPEIELHLPALLPEDYVADVHLRLTLYKRIASAADAQALEDLQVEMVDRFGPLPPPARNLYRLTGLKLAARELGIRKIDAGPLGGYVLFNEDNRADPQAVIRLVQRNSRHYRLDGPLKLRFGWKAESEAERFERTAELISSLQAGPAAAARRAPTG